MIKLPKELLRISPKNPKELQYSTNNGLSWFRRCSFSKDFRDLTNNGNELLATTSDGLYYSRNNGLSWFKRS
jgi:hypothetical protein